MLRRPTSLHFWKLSLAGLPPFSIPLCHADVRRYAQQVKWRPLIAIFAAVGKKFRYSAIIPKCLPFWRLDRVDLDRPDQAAKPRRHAKELAGQSGPLRFSANFACRRPQRNAII